MSAHPLADLENHVVKGFSIHSTIATDTTTNGTAVDMGDSDGPVYGIVSIGNSGDASTTIQVKLQESDASGGTYTDVSGATVSLAASATANDNTVDILKGLRTKQYVRAVVVTAGGGTPSVPIAVQVWSQRKYGRTNTGYSTT
jgi:hypothetical protein